MTEAAAAAGHTSARHNSLEKPLTPWGQPAGAAPAFGEGSDTVGREWRVAEV